MYLVGPGQLWVADITHVGVVGGLCLRPHCPRRLVPTVIGYAISRSIDALPSA